jgi:DNA-nicking Smr family endonuclease
MAKKTAPFHNPFQGLKLQKPEPPKPQAKSAPPPKKPAKRASGEDDAELFFQAMDGVVPLTERGEAPVPNVPLPKVVSDEAEAMAQLAELVSGEGPFDISDSDEFLEGSAPDVDRRILISLRRGDYAVQAHLDLHGMTRVEAREAVETFVANSRRDGKRCVLIVHGRGLHSKDQIAVLKEHLHGWLQRGRISRAVLAFATARPHDGGAGAVYVLLRKPRG